MRETYKLPVENAVFPEPACTYGHAVFRTAVKFGLGSVVFIEVVQKLFGGGG